MAQRFTVRLIAGPPHEVHKLTARDSSGRWAYYFVHVPAHRERAFLDALASCPSLDLEAFGTVLACNWGRAPSEETIRLLRERYGFDIG